MENLQKPWLKFYDHRVDEHVSVKHESLYDFLEDSVSRFGDKPALTFYGRSWSYNETKMIVDRLASALHKDGFKKGDRAALMLPNCPQYIFTLFAIFRLGGIAVQVNPMYVEREISFVLEDSDATHMFVLDALYPKVKKVQGDSSLRKVIAVGLGGERIALGEGDLYFEEVLHVPLDAPETTIDPLEDVAILQYTGGTTGVPKGVMLTHYNLLANFNQVCDFIFKTCDEVPESFKTITVLPMFHVYGLSSVALCCFREGANQIILPRFDVREVIETVKREKPFIFAAVPTMYFALNSLPPEMLKEAGFDQVHYVGSGGAPLAVKQARAFENVTGASIRDGYGLSESSPTVAFNPPFVPAKEGSIGIPVQSTIVRVVLETEEGEIVDAPIGEAGELIVNGPQVMKGYWNRPRDTDEVLKDGWLFTGDIARIDEDGFLYILDRKKDMIIASGYNVYPREVEEVLYHLPGIEETLVIGVPDEYRGETVKAFVKLRGGSTLTIEEIKQFAAENLAAYKAPKEVEILDDLPKSSVGKLLRRVLRDEELGKVQV
ncbi:long-chain fatty acid--CoA ligase [Bacillus sp. FJAT-27251]|uniref:long-chain-fatty-acid--CoA ligase n=1 Tax=Bacillus sp. FJAT-27251 TaxID=1684142 RepID=UPI0006A7ABBE|nr:long-chain fatty acid--CoA ligase [Bacillus sp. FJAT-27251]